MRKKISRALMLAACLQIFMISPSPAETIVVECPKVYAKNPFTLLRIENGVDWQASESSGYVMHCRSYINPQGYLTCFYTPAAHGASDVFTLKRLPPEETTCKETNIECRFECTKAAEPPKVERSVKPPMSIPRLK
ncbi:MAG: hypothetical protein OEW04_09705 [Nitrospirota bacterium]|nr:hypothetical protein [Nitrospirota bacterium]